MDNTGILVYCITDRNDEKICNIRGMDGKGRLYAIENEGLFVIVSDIGLDEYGEEEMASKGEDVNWLKEKAAAFMDIILQVTAFTDIIPMKFLTIFKTEERVRSIITDNLAQFQEDFMKIKGRKELSLKIYCDDKKYKESTVAQDVEEFEKTLAGKAKGAAFFLRKKFDTELNDKIQSRICTAANSMIDSLKAECVDTKINKLLARELTGVDLPMIQNCSFLVDNKNEESFRNTVGKLADEYSTKGFMLNLSGPWPPYSFCG